MMILHFSTSHFFVQVHPSISDMLSIWYFLHAISCTDKVFIVRYFFFFFLFGSGELRAVNMRSKLDFYWSEVA